MLRYLCVSEEITKKVMGYKINIFVIMSLERSEKIAKEREYALNFVRHLVLVDSLRIRET